MCIIILVLLLLCCVDPSRAALLCDTSFPQVSTLTHSAKLNLNAPEAFCVNVSGALLLADTGSHVLRAANASGWPLMLGLAPWVVLGTPARAGYAETRNARDAKRL